ncbi:MAG: hypothetical protein U1F12_11035 [Pseudomonadales bacterium]|jgi:hypothetical protein
MTRQLALSTFCALWLAIGFFIYGSTGHDDSHINFWNVHTLLTQGELVNYNGERVEQTTSLLQDFITAALVIITRADIVTLGYLVDIAAALGCCWLSTVLARQLAPALANWASPLILSSASFLLWSFGGMGAPLTALCLLAGVFCWWRWLTFGTHFWQILCITIALVLVRPEMPVVITAITASLIAVFFFNREQRQRAWILFAITTSAAAALFVWQQWYFDSWLPIPAIAKQGGSFSAQLQRGTYYVIFGGALNPMAALAVLLSLPMLFLTGKSWWKKTLQPLNYLLAITLCGFFAYGGFVWAAGGDWMQASRFFVPIIPLATLVLLCALQALPYRILTHAVITLLVGAQFALQYPVVAQQSRGTPVWVQSRISPEHAVRYNAFEKINQEHVRDFAVIDHLAEIIPTLHEELKRPVVLMSGQAGMVFYYTAQQFYGKVIFRDLRGLVESSLTLCPELRHLPRSSQGLAWNYRNFFEQLPNLQKACNIAAPDIIYDIAIYDSSDMSQTLDKMIAPFGYTLIHREGGWPVVNNTNLPYNRLLAPNMIFVRNDLLPLLNNPTLRVFNYKELPLTSRWPHNYVR